MATALTADTEPILTPEIKPALPRQATDLVRDLAATNDFSDCSDDERTSATTCEPDEPVPDQHASSTSRRALAGASRAGRGAVVRRSWAKPILGQGWSESRINTLASRADAVRKSFSRRPSQLPPRRAAAADENAPPAARVQS